MWLVGWQVSVTDWEWEAMPRDDRIESQLRAWADDLAQQVPPEDAPIRQPRRWVPVAALTAGAAAIVLSVVGIQVRDRRDGAPVETVGRSAQMTTTTASEPPADVAQADAFAAMARSLTQRSVDAVRFANPLRLALGGQQLNVLPSHDLAREQSWQVNIDGYAARSGQASILELIRSRPPADIEVHLERGAGCHAPDRLPSVAHDRVMSIQPIGIESCLDWFAIDLYVTDGLIALVDLRLYEP